MTKVLQHKGRTIFSNGFLNSNNTQEGVDIDRCIKLFVVMFNLEGAWYVAQKQSKLCSNLEIRTEKCIVP